MTIEQFHKELKKVYIYSLKKLTNNAFIIMCTKKQKIGFKYKQKIWGA